MKAFIYPQHAPHSIQEVVVLANLWFCVKPVLPVWVAVFGVCILFAWFDRGR